eukprot:m.303018 g.303018  ORF g.303018 m.303018 type:complete len:266 (-) comp15890_c0_seq33:2571-3368(-)
MQRLRASAVAVRKALCVAHRKTGRWESTCPRINTASDIRKVLQDDASMPSSSEHVNWWQRHATDDQQREWTEQNSRRPAEKVGKCAYDLGLRVIPNVVTDSEVAVLMGDVEKKLHRMRYSEAHFDQVISGYRELHRRDWTPACSNILARLKAHPLLATQHSINQDVHVLDLAEHGEIGAHVDSIKFVGPVIAGVCVLSPAVVRFEEEDGDDVVEALIQPNTMYIMSGAIRYKYTHAVTDSTFTWNDSPPLHRTRRISFMFRAPEP